MAAPLVHVEEEEFSDSEAISEQNESSGDESSVDNDEENPQIDSDAENDASKSGLGNVISKILNKNIESKCSVLSKGLTDRQIHKKRKLKEAEDHEAKGKRAKSENSSEESASEDSEDEDDKKSTLKIDPLRMKPDPLRKDFEKTLQKIATKGVVHLFNAVKKQQKTIDEKMKEAGSSEVKKSRVMKTVTKGSFLDMLKPTDKSQKSVDSISKDNEPSWKILRDDFMMGAKLKDWDKESDDGVNSDG